MVGQNINIQIFYIYNSCINGKPIKINYMITCIYYSDVETQNLVEVPKIKCNYKINAFNMHSLRIIVTIFCIFHVYIVYTYTMIQKRETFFE